MAKGRDHHDYHSGEYDGGGYAGFNGNSANGRGGGGKKGGGRSNAASSPPVSPLEDLMRKRGVDTAWNELEKMHHQGVTTDRFTISRMLMKTVGDARGRYNPQSVYRGVGLVEDFIALRPEEADEVLFNALLDTCCRLKDLKRLESTVLLMHELQIVPSHVTLGILVKAYGQTGDVSRVMKVWEEMSEQRQQANAVTFGCMIDACVKCGHMEKAIGIFQDMKKRQKHRNTILYTTLIKGYGLEQNLSQALMLFKEMRTEGVPYNTVTYNSIVDVCIRCDDVQTAEELLREMLSPGSVVEPDLITFSTLLKGYCHVGDLDRALQVAETIKGRGFKCDELVYNTLMDGCVKANDLSAGIGLFAEMTQDGMRPSSITHSILMRLYQRNGYKGDSTEAVAQLYQHHGLERPSEQVEHRSRAGRKNKGRGAEKSAAAGPPSAKGQELRGKGGGKGNGAPFDERQPLVYAPGPKSNGMQHGYQNHLQNTTLHTAMHPRPMPTVSGRGGPGHDNTILSQYIDDVGSWGQVSRPAMGNMGMVDVPYLAGGDIPGRGLEPLSFSPASHCGSPGMSMGGPMGPQMSHPRMPTRGGGGMGLVHGPSPSIWSFQDDHDMRYYPMSRQGNGVHGMTY